ncbi:MAG: chloride channel protein [Alphaproteobacteria bacterium]|nr:chloride channel protein [Alphaproteobacteria bacterium]
MNYRPHNLTRRVRSFSKIWVRQVPFFIGAVIVALTAILFAKASEFGNDTFSSVIERIPYLSLIITPLGFAFVVYLTHNFFQGTEGSGIPQVIAALNEPEMAERVSLLSLRVAFGKVLLTTLALCFGASMGREGPTVQVGASIMQFLTRIFQLPSPPMRRALLMAGGAAGIAAAFNTPLAGILFAIEELSHSFEERTSGTAFTAVIIAGIVSVSVLGDYSYFGHVNVGLSLEQAWKPVLLCGVLGGLFGGLFARLLILFARGLPGRAGVLISSRPVAFAALCGFALAILGQMSGQTIFGTGYDQAKGLIEGSQDLSIFFGPLKFLATVVSYISGIPGGIFAPSLAVGAGLGADLTSLFPDIPAAAIIILGMVGYFTGVVQVPITATIIVMEMTEDQTLTLPLMATALLAHGLSKFVCPTPLYQTLAEIFLERASRRQERPEGLTPRPM